MDSNSCSLFTEVIGCNKNEFIKFKFIFLTHKRFHCSRTPEQLSVIVGTMDLRKVQNVLKVDYIHGHPKYFKAHDHNQSTDDIGLIHLSQPLKFNKSVQKISLQTDRLKNKNIEAILTGWGETKVLMSLISSKQHLQTNIFKLWRRGKVYFLYFRQNLKNFFEKYD